jgi:outer membrane protein OmpA-like peptidoglycan-associated protein
VLYQNGIGYFERGGRLEGRDLELNLRAHEVDDVLRSLTVVEDESASRPEIPLTITAAVPHPRIDDEGQLPENTGLDVHLSRAARGRLKVSYTTPVPTWRPVYRVVLPEKGEAEEGLLQCWALVHNASNESWRDVDLTLATDAPFSYALDLWTPRFVPRPDVTGRMVQPAATGAVRAEQARGGGDEDGIPDEDDLCPSDAEDLDGFEDDDGCPDPDNDQDRILDASDECPESPEVYNAFEDEDGCPDRGRVEIRASRITIMDQIYFAEISGEVRSISQPIIDAVAATINGNPQFPRIEIRGHAADNEPNTWNLSAERAAAVRQALIEAGVSEERLTLQAFGATQPIAPGRTADDRERNRRVEFHIEGIPEEEPVVSSDQGSETSPQAHEEVVVVSALSGTVYRLGQRVSILAGTSTLVSIMTQRIPVEEILLFRPDPNAPGSDRHPMRAARLVNASDQELAPGPLTLFAGNDFLGEGILDRINPRESAFVPFGLARGSWIVVERQTETLPNRVLSVARGVVMIEDINIWRTSYAIEVGARAPARIFITHGRTAGYEGVELPPRTEITPTGYLVPLPLAEGRRSVLEIREQRPASRRINLLDDLGTLLETYLASSELDPETTGRLREIIGLRNRIRQTREEIRTLRGRVGDSGTRLAQIRRSLTAAGTAGRAAADLRRRLTERLARSVEESEELSQRLATATAEETELREGLADAAERLGGEPPE